jgi:hypothetical protein
MPQNIDATLLNRVPLKKPAQNSPTNMQGDMFENAQAINKSGDKNAPTPAELASMTKMQKLKAANKMLAKQTDMGQAKQMAKIPFQIISGFFRGDMLHLTPEKTAALLEASWKSIVKTFGFSAIYIYFHGFMRYIWRSDRFSDYGVFFGKVIGKGPGEKAEQVIVLASAINISIYAAIVAILLYLLFFGLCNPTSFDLLNKLIVTFAIPTCNVLN